MWLIQRIELNKILEDEYFSYTYTLKSLGIQTLSELRKHLCLKFGKKYLCNEEFSKWFKTRILNLKTKTKNKKCRKGGIMQALYATPAWAYCFYVFLFFTLFLWGGVLNLFLMHDAWFMMHNAWCMMHDTRCIKHDGCLVVFA